MRQSKHLLGGRDDADKSYSDVIYTTDGNTFVPMTNLPVENNGFCASIIDEDRLAVAGAVPLDFKCLQQSPIKGFRKGSLLRTDRNIAEL